jgi:hypothetical protein
MPFDTSGALLEGVRISEGNNPYSYPPRDLVSNASAFNAVTARSEYVLIAYSTDPVKAALEIADPELRFRWTRNQSTVVRFSYDSFSKRWITSPGSTPDVLGLLSNDKRVVAPIPDLSVASAPFALYVGSPVRAVTFTVVIVGEAADFTPPSSLPGGTVQLSSKDGKLNFSASDVSIYGGADVLCQRQSFFDRQSSSGRIGTLPASSEVPYFLFTSPRPGTGQTPLVRINYGRQLPGTEYATEADLPVPAAGTFAWSADTGRVVLSPSDVDGFAGQGVYYDGVVLASVAPASTAVSPPVAWPSASFSVPVDSVGLIDQRYVVYAEKAGSARTYWTVVPSDAAPAKAPLTGTVVVRTDTGQAYFAAADAFEFSSWSFSYLDSLMPVEEGVSFQVFRSGVNGSGESQVPDFTIAYPVDDQVIVDGISQAPFVMLPTVPVTDSSLVYRIEQGPSSSGTFTGALADGTNPAQQGAAYLLDLDRKQFKFVFRKTVSLTLQNAVPAVKLADAAISPLGFVASRDGVPVEPGVDFDFDATTGTLSFTEPMGQNGPGDGSALSGVVPTASLFFLDPAVGFVPADVGKYVLVHTGPNVGIRRISSVNLGRGAVSPAFAQTGPITFDVRSEADVVVDRFWTPVDPPYKKFSLASGPGPSGPFTAVPRSGYTVLPSVSQVNLTSPAPPGISYMATYVGLVTTDDGATYTPVNLVELGTFKVRQETAASTPGSSLVIFNPEGRTVAPVAGFKVYVSGVPLDPEFFQFQAPGTLRLANPVIDGQTVVLDYFVQEALGGETSFNLAVQPMDLDSLEIAAGQTVVTMNGDQTSAVQADSVLWVGQIQAAFVASSVYDSSSDVTTITLSGSGLASDSSGAAVLSCAPLQPSYFVPEMAAVGQFIAGSNSFVVAGDVTSEYRGGTVVSLGDDAYVVISSQFVPSSVNTRVTVASPARANYIVPAVDRSVRPVFLPGKTFQTTFQADLSFPFDLVRMGSSPSVLVQGVDYDVTAGGSFVLREQVGFGDELYALYVAFVTQPAGTVLSLNYSYAIAPGPANGLAGQRLASDYVLYAPDTFFYRVETVLSFIPEVQDLLRAGATSSGSSGPNTQSATGMANKDFGRPSLYFEQQHQGNLDFVTARLLLFYNDLINYYEDLLADIDGRVVGGSSGRFRFDDNFDNPPRQTYAQVTNDIDDRIKLYDKISLTGFFTFSSTPVYGTMAFPNALSRIFPTQLEAAAAINNQVSSAQRGSTLGSLGIENIQSVGTLSSAPASQFFTSVSGMAYTVAENGQQDLLVPPFAAGQQVRVFAPDGSPDVAGNVVSVTGTGPFVVTLDVATTLGSGSILQDVSAVPVTPTATSNHFYQPGRDISVDPANGQLKNITVGPPFIPALGGGQLQVWGNEVIQGAVNFGNKDMSARRIPALDGSTLNDDGLVPAPRLEYVNESALLADETAVISGVGNAKSAVGAAQVAAGGLDVVASTLFVAVGDFFTFVSGPNAGAVRQVTAIVDGSHFQVGTPLVVDALSRPVSSLSLLVSSTLPVSPGASVLFLSGPNVGTPFTVLSSTATTFKVAQLNFPDPGSNFEVSVVGLFLSDIVAAEIGVLATNVAASAVPPAVVGRLTSEISTAVVLIQYSGPVLASGSGTAAGLTLTDPFASFILAGVVAGSLVFVPGGANFGLYRVSSVASHVLTLDAVSPFVAFPSPGSTSYQVIQPESFLKASQWGVVSQFLRETAAFYALTLAWFASLSPSGVPARLTSLAARQAQLAAYLVAFQKVLVDGKLYDTRYILVNQRVDRQDGNLVKESQADARRVSNLARMLADQQKLLIFSQI